MVLVKAFSEFTVCVPSPIIICLKKSSFKSKIIFILLNILSFLIIKVFSLGAVSSSIVMGHRIYLLTIFSFETQATQ